MPSGRKVFIVVVSAGLISQASASIRPQLSFDSPAPTDPQVHSQSSEFSLSSGRTETFSLGGNESRGLLAEVAPELHADFQIMPTSAEQIIAPLTDGLVWEPLWFNAARIPISAVPEPSALALLTVGTTLLYAFRRACHRGRW